MNKSLENLSNEKDCPDKVVDLIGSTRRNISFIKNPTSSLPLFVFEREPKCRNFLDPNELVSELNISISLNPSLFTCVCNHSKRSEFSFSRTPSLTYKSKLNANNNKCILYFNK